MSSPGHWETHVARCRLHISTLVMSFLEAWHSAGFTDPVTGLPNRQRLIRDLQYLAVAGDTTPRRLVG